MQNTWPDPHRNDSSSVTCGFYTLFFSLPKWMPRNKRCGWMVKWGRRVSIKDREKYNNNLCADAFTPFKLRALVCVSNTSILRPSMRAALTIEGTRSKYFSGYIFRGYILFDMLLDIKMEEEKYFNIMSTTTTTTTWNGFPLIVN